jgi:predicted nucleotidyltransferase
MAANQFVELLERLTKAGVRFTIVGGTAAVLHGAATATYDLDILMPFEPSNCEALLQALAGLNPRLSHTPDKRPLALDAEQLSAYKNLYLSTDIGRLDVLGSLPPLVDTDALIEQSVRIPLGHLEVRVLALESLLAVKAAMNRPKDKQVEAELRAIRDAIREPD